jgi:hypothetical protein
MTDIERLIKDSSIYSVFVSVHPFFMEDWL